MKWITQEKARVDRIACPWLITRFVDLSPEFVFLRHDADWPTITDRTVLDFSNAELGYHSEYCSFDAIIGRLGLGKDLALAELAKLVHAASEGIINVGRRNRSRRNTTMNRALANQQEAVDHTRRAILRLTPVVVCSLAFGTSLAHAADAPPPKETGLSFEGLLKGKPGFQPRTPAPLPITEIPGFLSKKQLARNYAAYRDVVAKLLAAESELASVSRDAAHAKEYAALRAQQINSANSVLLHEFYFENLAPSAVKPSRYVLSNMTEHMGTVDSWREDFIACARVAQSWTVLVYDPYDDRWHNAPLGESEAGGWIGSNPLVVCDVSDDAWSIDYKDREKYVTRFLDNIAWSVVASRYHAVDRQ